MDNAEYAKLLEEYRKAVELYRIAVRGLAAAKDRLVFEKRMRDVNVTHAKCENFHSRLYEARKKAGSN
jgi:hypothetical protein